MSSIVLISNFWVIAWPIIEHDGNGIFLKCAAKKVAKYRKIGEKCEIHKNKVLFTLFEKGSLPVGT